MASSLSNLVKNLAEIIHEVKCKNEHDDKKCETCGIKYKDCENYLNVKRNLIQYKCLSWNKNYPKIFDKNLKKRSANTYKLANHDIKKFILLLSKGVYLYEQIDHLGKFNDTSLPEIDVFYSHLNMEDNTDADYIHTEGVCKDFKITNLGVYHDLCVIHYC